MITRTIQIQEISVDELAEKVSDKLLNKIQLYLEQLSLNESDVFLTRNETADFLILTCQHYGIGLKKEKLNAMALETDVITTNRRLLQC